MSHRVVHFEIHAENPERAITFYSGAFGWRFEKWDGPMPYWMVMTGAEGEPGINGGLMPRQGPPPGDGQPLNAYGCTIGTDHLDADLETLARLGGQVVLPKMPIPGVGWLAYAKDTEGNIFGLMQEDRQAGASPS